MAKRALHVLIASVSLSALLGIYALLVGDFGDIEIRILFSTLSVAGASILAMASAAAWERGSGRRWAAAGIAGSIAGFALVLVGVWLKADGEWLWKTAFALVVVGCAGAHGALLGLARVPPSRRWVVASTHVASVILALAVVGLIILEGDPEGLWRLVGALAIAATTGTLVAVILQRLDRSRPDQPQHSVQCPHCAGELSATFLADALAGRVDRSQS